MTDLAGLDRYITAPDYVAEDRSAELEKAGEYVDKLSAQEIAEEVFSATWGRDKWGNWRILKTAEQQARDFLAEYGARVICEAHPHLTFMAEWFGEADDGEGCIRWLMWTDEDCLRFLEEDCCKGLLLEHFGEGLAEQVAEAWNEPPERDPWN